MFFRRSIFFVLFGLMLIFGLLGLRQRSSFARGYSEGYTTAQQQANANDTGESAAETSGAEASPARPPQAYPRMHGWGFFPLFGIFGFFLKFWLMFLIFGFFMKMLGFGRHRGWHRGHWCKGEEEPREKQPEDVEPDIRYT
jgi:hypothetical protein